MYNEDDLTEEDMIPEKVVTYDRKCLGLGCSHAFKTTNKFIRLCRGCRKRSKYRFDKYNDNSNAEFYGNEEE